MPPALLDMCLPKCYAVGASCLHPFSKAQGPSAGASLALCSFLEISITHMASPVTSLYLFQ